MGLRFRSYTVLSQKTLEDCWHKFRHLWRPINSLSVLTILIHSPTSVFHSLNIKAMMVNNRRYKPVSGDSEQWVCEPSERHPSCRWLRPTNSDLWPDSSLCSHLHRFIITMLTSAKIYLTVTFKHCPTRLTCHRQTVQCKSSQMMCCEQRWAVSVANFQWS